MTFAPCPKSFGQKLIILGLFKVQKNLLARNRDFLQVNFADLEDF